VAAPGAPVLVPFPPGSAALPPQALAPLKMISRQISGRPVLVTGYGDAASADAATQAAAMPLALARARAIAGNLLSAGVPANVIRISAEAQGHGGAARIGN
jgi:outer membrane protein OmpA-like peptidoglycan-associated protein